MNDQNQKKTWMEQYLRQEVGLTSLKKNFHCLNPEHEDRHPSMSYDPKRGVVHCFSCLETYDIYDLLRIEKGLNYRQAKDYLEDLPATSSMPIKKEEVEIKDHRFSNYIETCHQQLDKKTIDYLKGRGINEATIDTERIGCDPFYWTGEKLEHVLIFSYGPTDPYYMARTLERKAFYKPSSLIAGQEPIYHAQNLQEETIIVTESILDLLSIEQETNWKGISLCGLGSEKLISQTQTLPSKTFVLCLDQDEPGQKTGKILAEKLRTQGHQVIHSPEYRGYKDLNELLVNSSQGFAEYCKELEHTIQQIPHPKSKEDPSIQASSDWQSEDVWDLLEALETGQRSQSFLHLPSGIDDLDKRLAIQEGSLVVLGGLPGCGKTTWATQWAETIALSRDVYYLSLEQSALQLATLSYKRKQTGKNIGHTRFLRGKEGGFEGLDSLELPKGSVLFIDYLQMLSFGGSDIRQQTDRNIQWCKQFANKIQGVVVVISSISRSNYLQPLDLESFKESGGIEYSADVVLGLQYRCVHQKVFNEEGRLAQKRDLLNKEREKTVRSLEFVGLKQRFGSVGWQVPVQFDCQNALFIPEKVRTQTESLTNRL